MPARNPLAFAMIAASTALGIAGTDLVLPAVPSLPAILGGSLVEAQLVLAGFTAGAAAGLLIFGELGARFDQRRLLVLSLAAYAVLSGLCATSPSLPVLIGLRVLQGASSAAAAVFAPGMLRALHGDARAVAAIGLLGSIEALAPALAPIVGVWLLCIDWRASFVAIAAIAMALAALVQLLSRRHLPVVTARPTGGYARLLRHGRYLRLALSHALTLGALLVIVFDAPVVFVAGMGGTLGDFLLLQVTGVAAFITAATVSGRIVQRVGAMRLIVGGTMLALIGVLAIVLYGLGSGGDPLVVTVLFVFVNIGFGLRGPPGFHAAIVVAEDDARGAAVLVVAILLAASLGTAAVAPFIVRHGLVAAGAGATLLAGTACLLLLPEWRSAR